MCRFENTKIANLYCHEVRKDNLFLYTEKNCPDSLYDCFEQGDFLIIFCGEPVEDSVGKENGTGKLALAAAGLMKYMAGKADGILAFMEQKSDSYLNWTVMQLCREAEDKYVLMRTCRFALQGYYLLIPAGTYLSVETEKNGEDKIIWRFGCRKYAMEFVAESLLCVRNQMMELIMEGEMAGCFFYEMRDLKGLHQLGVGIRFSMEREQAVHGRYVDTLSCMPFFPLFSPVNLQMLLDVTAPDDNTRSRVILPEGRYGSFFPVYCAPDIVFSAVDGDMSLVFGKERIYHSNTYFKRYLTPEGSMQIESPDGSMLTGISGLEYIDFHKGGRIYFHSGQKAYFPVDEYGLEDNGTASYIAFDSGIYYSQGETSSFFGGIGEGTLVLSYQEIPFRQVGREDVLPVLPVGIRDNPKNGDYIADYIEQEQTKTFTKLLESIDTRRLAQRRNLLMGQQIKAFYGDAGTITAITQKGLLASFEPGAMSFSAVELSDKFRLSNVNGNIRQALLSARAFLLISDKEDFLKYASIVEEQFPLSIGGWTFDFSPDMWKENNTLLLLKYTSHKSIRELADASLEWSYPREDEELVRKNSMLLNEILADADNTKDIASFDSIRKLIDDRDWCGVVIFSVQVDGNSLPDNIRFLTKTTNGKPLLAHHLTFESRTVGRDGSVLPGEISGVIFYSDPFHPAIDNPGEFYYKLDQLLVVIERSEVTDFKCSLSLSINYFLKSPLYAIKSDMGNYMLIRGGMVENKEDETLNEYYFELYTPREYEVAGSAVEIMLVEGVSLMASYSENKVSFFLSGRLKFQLYDSDIFSYGDDESYLYFDNLLLMIDNGIYYTDISAMHFLTDISKVRKGSFGEQFRVTWKEFLIVESRNSVEKLGYTGLHCDGIRQEKLGETFVCIVMEISLGRLGALAEAGDLKLSLLTAWTPYPSENQYDGSVKTEAPGLYLGVRIGAFTGVSSPIPLQGVMSMGFDRIEIKKSKETDEFYFYLRDFSVKLLKYQFPDGNNDIYIFGNSKNPDKLGWYGAYDAKEKKDVH